jgi:hypothetical protein
LTTPSPASQSGDLKLAQERGDCEVFLSMLDAHDRMLRTLAYRMLGEWIVGWAMP